MGETKDNSGDKVEVDREVFDRMVRMISNFGVQMPVLQRKLTLVEHITAMLRVAVEEIPQLVDGLDIDLKDLTVIVSRVNALLQVKEERLKEQAVRSLQKWIDTQKEEVKGMGKGGGNADAVS